MINWSQPKPLMEDHCTFATLLELSSGAAILVKMLITTSHLAILVSITKSPFKAQKNFLLGMELPFRGPILPSI
jgi:hypothetical protein